MNLTSQQLTSMGIALGACAAVYHFVKNPLVRSAAVAVGAVIVAKQVPYVGTALA